eukprot:1030320-Amphidinium_carterae.1
MHDVIEPQLLKMFYRRGAGHPSFSVVASELHVMQTQTAGLLKTVCLSWVRLPNACLGRQGAAREAAAERNWGVPR